MSGSSPEPPTASAAAFATTHWTVVLEAAGSNPRLADQALEELCRTYWRPIYAFVRRLGHAPPDAQDLTQEFFARLIAGDVVRKVSPERGRFRSYLLATLKHFLANEWDRARAQKRGGGVTIVPLTTAEEDPALPLEEARNLSPERVYDRQWAMAVLERVLLRLQDEHIAAGKATLFDGLKDTLTCERDRKSTR